MDLRLRPLRDNDEAQARAAQAELAREGFRFLLNGYAEGEPWQAYLTRVEGARRRDGLAPGMVPATLLVAEVEDALVGRASIRHELNDRLLRMGGHIGYGVRPAHRRRGYGTEILRQAVIVARSLGVDRVLVTCDEDNAASRTVIERCGGVREEIAEVPGEVRQRRYWIG